MCAAGNSLVEEQSAAILVADRCVRCGLAIDNQMIVLQFDAVAGHGYNTLHETNPVRRRWEHDDVATLRIGPFREIPRRKGDFQIVRELVYENAVANQDCRHHRPAWHVIPIGYRRTQRRYN